MSSVSEFEFAGRVTIGQYLPTGSILHRLDPRAKLLMVLLLTVGVVAGQSLTGMCILLLAVLLLLAISRVSLRFALAGLRPAIPFLLILALIQVVSIPQRGAQATFIWRWGPLTITDGRIIAGLLLVARFLVMGLGISLFSFCTTTTELTHGIEHLLRPLQALGLPAHEFALVVNIAIRFLPMLAEETERLMKAQASRGADFGRAQRNVFARARRLLPLFVPLFLVSLRRADQLIEAMEARSYLGGRGRTYLIHLTARLPDCVGVLLAATAVAVNLWLSRAGADQHLLRRIASGFR